MPWFWSSLVCWASEQVRQKKSVRQSLHGSSGSPYFCRSFVRYPQLYKAPQPVYCCSKYCIAPPIRQAAVVDDTPNTHHAPHQYRYQNFQACTCIIYQGAMLSSAILLEQDSKSILHVLMGTIFFKAGLLPPGVMA